MRKRRYTEAQIVAILQELGAGRSAAELARKHGVHVNTLRLWRSKYAGLDVSDLTRLKELESENSQMERIIARQALEIRAMSEMIRKTGGALSAQGSGEGVRGLGDEPAASVPPRALPSTDRTIQAPQTPRRRARPRSVALHCARAPEIRMAPAKDPAQA